MAAKADKIQALITDQLNAGEYSFEQVFRLLLTKVDLSRQTFSKYWKIAVEQHKIEQGKINAKKTELASQNEIEGFKSKILTKVQKIDLLQKQVDKSEQELEDDQTEEVIFRDGSLLKEKRSLTIGEKAALRKVIKELTAEINKMQGDYAPIQTQTDLTLNGNGDLPIDKWLKDAESK
jgi:hypothetical protein